MRPPTYTRVSLLAPRRRIDVALPADVPLGELVPMVLELLGESDPGFRPWRLTAATGGPLHPAATLEELGVLDGELLRIGPEAAAPPPPFFNDPVDALASTAGRRSAPAGSRATAGAAAVQALAGAALLVAVPIGLPQPGWWAAGAAAVAILATAGALGRVSMLVRRDADTDTEPEPDAEPDSATNRAAASTAALVAIPPAATAGFVALAAFPISAQVLLGAAAAGTVAAVAQVLLRVVQPLLVGVVVASVPIGVVAVLHLRWGIPVGVLGAGLGAVALVVAPLLPRAALRLAGLPLPVVPADAAELMDAAEWMDDEVSAERADLARGHLAGLVGGCAVLAGASAPVAATTGGWAGPTLAAVIVVVLGLRARGFADPAPARTLLVISMAAGIALATVVLLAFPPAGRLLIAALVVLSAAVTVAADREQPTPSPVARRAVDLLEGALVAAAVPLALGAMGLYALVRSL